MSTLANMDWGPRGSVNTAAAEMPFPVSYEGISMRQKLAVVRDTIMMAALQVAFRAAMVLRHWNY